jgi:ribosomal protein L32
VRRKHKKFSHQTRRFNRHSRNSWDRLSRIFVVILKGVPAEVGNNCGEYYLSDTVTEQVLKSAEIAVNEVLR